MHRVSHQELFTGAETIVRALGAPEETATEVVDHLVRADLCGHGSHGVRMLPMYAELIEEEILIPDASPDITELGPSHIQVDGRGCFGQVAGAAGIDRAIELAQDRVVTVGISNTTHLGRIGEYGERAANAGKLLVALVNAISPPGPDHVAPVGSTQGRLGTNPICFAIPTFDAIPHPVVADMATSQVAMGKIRRRAAVGDSLEPEWTSTPSHEPVADPERFQEGEDVVLPIGGRTTGHKGFALGTIAELFAGIVSDSKVSGQSEPEIGNHAVFFVADPTLFTTPGAIEDRVRAFDEFIQSTDQSNASTGKTTFGDRPMLPGAPEHKKSKTHETEGIPMPAADLRTLYELAEALGTESEVPDAWEHPD